MNLVHDLVWQMKNPTSWYPLSGLAMHSSRMQRHPGEGRTQFVLWKPGFRALHSLRPDKRSASTDQAFPFVGCAALIRPTRLPTFPLLGGGGAQLVSPAPDKWRSGGVERVVQEPRLKRP